MKRFWIILLVLLVLTGCAKGGKEMNGEIVTYGFDEAGTWTSFTLDVGDGELREVVLKEDAWLLCVMESVEDEDFRRGKIPNARVHVTYEKEKGTYYATEVQLIGRLLEETLTLRDGTRVKIRETMFNDREYVLESGKVLLYEQGKIGPDNVAGNGERLADLPQVAQEKILSYYAAQEPYYDVETLVQEAYDVWNRTKNNGFFQGYSVHVNIIPTASSEKVICFLTEVSAPVDGEEEYLRWGTFFDKETGEEIRTYDLFTCNPEEVLDVLFETVNVGDEELEQQMRQALVPSLFVMFPDSMEIQFPEGALYQDSLSHGIGCDMEALAPILHPWAIPVDYPE